MFAKVQKLKLNTVSTNARFNDDIQMPIVLFAQFSYRLKLPSDRAAPSSISKSHGLAELVTKPPEQTDFSTNDRNGGP